jgi:hypothetical protein
LKKALFFLYLIFTSTSLSAKIIETEHFYEILEHANGKKILVILDIDDTLLIPIQTLGSDVWFCDRVKEYQEKMLCPSDALRQALIEWEGIRHLTKIQIVEEGTDKVIQEMQEKNITVMGLSTQALTLTECTSNQLKSINIDLSLKAPSKNDYYFNNPLGVLYTKGILFTSGTDKGMALFKFLDAIGFSPSHVIFINDKETHLKNVEKDVLERGIEFIGLRYSYCDQRVKNYDRKIAEIQWKYSTLGEILSDDKAKELMKEEI